LQVICARQPHGDILLQAHIWVLEAYSKSTGGARQCQQLLNTIKELNATSTDENSNPSPTKPPLLDAEVYSNVILAWSKVSDANVTLDAPLELVDLYLAGAFGPRDGTDRLGSEPSLMAFNGVLSAWGQVDRIDKAEQVLWLMGEKLQARCPWSCMVYFATPIAKPP
jgi:hypothetical protein